MKKSDLIALMLLVTVLCGIGAYYFGYRGCKPRMDELDNEIAELQARYDDLKAKEAKRDWYIEETKRLKQEFEEELTIYPADLNQESTVIYLKGTEEMYDTFKNINVGLPQEASFYTIGASATANETGDIVANDNQVTTEPYVCTKCEYPINFTASYEQLKDYLDYVAEYKYRMNISQINMSYNPDTDLLIGSLSLDAYAISGPDRVPDVPVVDEQPQGVENIFLGGEGAVVSADASKYADNNGADIIGTHNLIILLNNAANDAASGVIVASDESDEKTYVSFDNNEVAQATVSIYTESGKSFIKYEIGDESHETEILTSDVTIYVKSSERVDSDDKNGVNVSINNTSGLPVYVKVVDDDSSSPRFKVGQKSGSVKIYN